MSGDFDIVESHLLVRSARPIRVDALDRTAFASRWDSASTFGRGELIGVARRAHRGATFLDVLRVHDRIEHVGSYEMDGVVPCADLDATGRLIVADRTGIRAPRGSLVLRIVGPDVDRSMDLGESHGWPQALRVVGPDRAALWVVSEHSELLLIDTASGHVLDRADTDAEALGDGWLELEADGAIFAIGHGACQEQGLEHLDLNGDRWRARDWFVHAPEGLSLVGAHDGSFVTIERDPHPILRRRDSETGDILDERDENTTVPVHVRPTSRVADGWLVPTAGLAHAGDAVVHVSDALDAEIVAVLPAEARLHAWLEPQVALCVDSERVMVLRFPEL